MPDKPPSWISYFGFGSLVNRDTRPKNEGAVNVSLRGWGRVWNHRSQQPQSAFHCTSLSIEPADAEIEGVLVQIPAGELALLDQRESGYQRLNLPRSDFRLPENIELETIYVYRSLEVNRQLANEEYPILQSYVDCVMAGYHQRFGEDGLGEFLETTRGWEGTILNDRDAPRYPRSVTLPAQLLEKFDALLMPLR